MSLNSRLLGSSRLDHSYFSANQLPIYGIASLSVTYMSDPVFGSGGSAGSTIPLEGNLMDKATMEQAVEMTLTAPTAVDAGSITQVSPVDLGAVTVENKTSAPVVGQAGATIGHEAPVTAATTPAELEAYLLDIESGVKTAFQDLVGNINAKFTDQAGDLSAQVSEIQTKIGSVIGAVNIALENVRVKNIAQSTDLANAINTVANDLMGSINTLKAGIESVDSKVVALDDVYSTDAERAQAIADISDLIDGLDSSGLDAATALNAVIVELNALTRVQMKQVTVSAANGKYNFGFATEGFDAFGAASDYVVMAMVMDNGNRKAVIENRTATAFDIQVKTDGDTLGSVVADCSAEPVKVNLLFAHAAMAGNVIAGI